MATSILDKCQTPICKGCSCSFATRQQFVTLLAALAGIALAVLLIIRLVKIPIADIGAGPVGLMVVGLVMLVLTVMNKLSLSFAPNQTLALECKTIISAEHACSIANIITKLNKPLIERATTIERDILRSEGFGAVRTSSETRHRLTDVRLYDRMFLAKVAEKLWLDLLPLFSFVDAVMTDLAEVGSFEALGFNRNRFAAVPPASWLGDATSLHVVVIWEIVKRDRALGAVAKSLPGNIQILHH